VKIAMIEWPLINNTDTLQKGHGLIYGNGRGENVLPMLYSKRFYRKLSPAFPLLFTKPRIKLSNKAGVGHLNLITKPSLSFQN